MPTAIQAGAITLGGMTFGVLDDSGVYWVIESLDGWDTIGSTNTVTQKAGADGGWLDPAYLTPRVIQPKVYVESTSWTAVSLLLDQVWANLPVSTLTTFSVAESDTRSLQASVRMSDEPIVERLNNWARVSLSLLAPDPRRYSTTLTSVSTGLGASTGGLSLPVVLPVSLNATVASGRVQVTNAGTTSSPVMLSLLGPVPAGARITNITSGRSLVVPYAVPAGRTLVIDSASATALLDGSYQIVTGSFFDIAPGVNDIAFTAPTYDAGASLTVAFRSAWR